jgi:hypothetical protein
MADPSFVTSGFQAIDEDRDSEPEMNREREPTKGRR